MNRLPPVRALPHPDREIVLLRFRDGSERELRLDDAWDLGLDLLGYVREIHQRPTRDFTTGPPSP